MSGNIAFNPSQKERYLGIIKQGMMSRFEEYRPIFSELSFDEFRIQRPPYFLACIEICLKNADENGIVDVNKSRVEFEQRFGERLFPDVLEKIWGNTTDFLQEGNDAWAYLGREIQVDDAI